MELYDCVPIEVKAERTGVTDGTQGQWRTKIQIIEPVMGLSQVTFPQVKVALT